MNIVSNVLSKVSLMDNIAVKEQCNIFQFRKIWESQHNLKRKVLQSNASHYSVILMTKLSCASRQCVVCLQTEEMDICVILFGFHSFESTPKSIVMLRYGVIFYM